MTVKGDCPEPRWVCAGDSRAAGPRGRGPRGRLARVAAAKTCGLLRACRGGGVPAGTGGAGGGSGTAGELCVLERGAARADRAGYEAVERGAGERDSRVCEGGAAGADGAAK
jgi:hypothetical protein